MEHLVASVDIALRLMNIIAEKGAMGLTELSRVSGINKSRVYRLMCTLEDRHYIVKSGEPVVYRLGYQALVVGRSAKEQNTLVRLAGPILDHLQSMHDENLQIRVREHDEMVQIMSRASMQPLQVRSRAGNRRRLGEGASGEVLLAFAPQAVQEIFIRENENGIGFTDYLNNIREKNIAITKGAITPGIWAFAVPVFDENMMCVASMSLSAPAERAMNKERQFIKSLVTCSCELSAELACPKEHLERAYTALNLESENDC
ncbi:IclR family transcriptional regulator [Pantoea sp. EABMAA-21]|uniref:IclR family transcriptional regulator n=1 Tax=Enterobacterales TaxID=91347 RepID=UPI0024B4CDC2|nr:MULTISPECIES: IclR family transcriptional regulator [Enterobacterales]MDI9223622.1 IclR family transcriptional regulator [Pantoea sp. EA-12]MDI9265905.1 IclR family transcriptional regulator [Serratia sp. PF2-63]MDI9267127.1 IclR family transcriptional regulator [Serratia sp. PF-27]MDI9280136.1 IclR family transcriptional regulator [Pantoea sp. EABMAA-21]